MSIAVTPSRFGSKRFNCNTLAPVTQKPIIHRIYEQAIKTLAYGHKIKVVITKHNAPNVDRSKDTPPIGKRIWIQ